MTLYFLEIEARRFHEQLLPALAACYRRRDFGPCRELAASLLETSPFFVPELAQDRPLLAAVAAGLPFDRASWRLAVGEVLLFSATLPQLPTTPDVLERLTPGEMMRQAHFGSRDLRIGAACYQEGRTGLNDLADVERLAAALALIDSSSWRVEQLAGFDVDEEDRADALDFARDCLAYLTELYRHANAERAVIVCEQV